MKRKTEAKTGAEPERSEKPLLVLHGEIKTPPILSGARVISGFHLRRVQQGENLAMPLSRPMPAIGPNCHELRIGDTELDVEWRILYCIDDLASVILEIFKKTTPQTPEHIKKTCSERLNRYISAKEGT